MQFKGGLGGAAPVVFARMRVAEYRQNAVALNAGNSSAVLGNDLAAQLAQRLEHLGVVLGLHQFAQPGRIRQIGKQDCQVPASPQSIVASAITTCQSHAWA